jgi:hypothetical protein
MSLRRRTQWCYRSTRRARSRRWIGLKRTCRKSTPHVIGLRPALPMRTSTVVGLGDADRDSSRAAAGLAWGLRPKHLQLRRA